MSIVERLSDKLPRGIASLARSIFKNIPEESINETLDEILNFLSAAFVMVEKIQSDTPAIEQQEQQLEKIA